MPHALAKRRDAAAAAHASQQKAKELLRTAKSIGEITTAIQAFAAPQPAALR